jgi:hypothetical protein
MQTRLRIHASSRAAELERVGEHRRERACPTMDSGGVSIPSGTTDPSPQHTQFNQGVSLLDATTLEQLAFIDATLARVVSRLFLDPKPGKNQWRLICDLRLLNDYCTNERLKVETLLDIRHLTRKGDYISSLDLQDGFYAMGARRRRPQRGMRSKARRHLPLPPRGGRW